MRAGTGTRRTVLLVTDQGDCLTHRADAIRDLALALATKLDQGWHLRDLTTLLRDMARSSATPDPGCVHDVVLVAHGLLSGVPAPEAELRDIWGPHVFTATAIWAADAVAGAGGPRGHC